MFDSKIEKKEKKRMIFENIRLSTIVISYQASCKTRGAIKKKINDTVSKS